MISSKFKVLTLVAINKAGIEIFVVCSPALGMETWHETVAFRSTPQNFSRPARGNQKFVAYKLIHAFDFKVDASSENVWSSSLILKLCFKLYWHHSNLRIIIIPIHFCD